MSGLLERMGLVSVEHDDFLDSVVENGSCAEESENIPEIDVSQIDSDAIIQSIYEQGGFGDEASIFKIQAYIEILPPEMTTAKKQASIAGILAVNGIDVNSLIEDGRKRIAVLEETSKNTKSASDSLVHEAEVDIENLKSMIEAAEKKIADSKKSTDETCSAIEKEKEDVSALLEFAGGLIKTEGE